MPGAQAGPTQGGARARPAGVAAQGWTSKTETAMLDLAPLPPLLPRSCPVWSRIGMIVTPPPPEWEALPLPPKPSIQAWGRGPFRTSPNGQTCLSLMDADMWPPGAARSTDCCLTRSRRPSVKRNRAGFLKTGVGDLQPGLEWRKTRETEGHFLSRRPRQQETRK